MVTEGLRVLGMLPGLTSPFADSYLSVQRDFQISFVPAPRCHENE